MCNGQLELIDYELQQMLEDIRKYTIVILHLSFE